MAYIEALFHSRSILLSPGQHAHNQVSQALRDTVKLPCCYLLRVSVQVVPQSLRIARPKEEMSASKQEEKSAPKAEDIAFQHKLLPCQYFRVYVARCAALDSKLLFALHSTSYAEINDMGS